MKIKNIIVVIAFGLVMAGSISAQKTVPVKFTSVYTNLKTSCKELKGPSGTDPAYICKGAGSYQVREYYSAASTQINAELKGTESYIGLATLSIGYDSNKTVLEWRLANGKPFAVIMRQPVYADPVGDEQYFGKVTGQKLVIRGLVGFESSVEGEVDAKTPNANAKAREMADNAYKAKVK